MNGESRRFNSNQEIYHAVWKLVRDEAFDCPKRIEWRAWKHRFDAQISCADDALRFAAQMLASLEDEFTFLYSSDVAARIRLQSRCQSQVLIRNFDRVGYVRIKDFMSDDTDWQIQRALARLVHFESLIIDLRGNFGGQIEVALDSCQLFLPSGPLGSVKTRLRRFNHTLVSYEISQTERIVTKSSTYSFSKPFQERERRRLLDVLGGRPVVILIDEETASAAEMFALVLQEHGAKVVGAESFGKGIGQSHIPLNGVATLQITTSRYYSPLGKWLGDAQKRRYGVVPDIQQPEQPQNKLSNCSDRDPLKDSQLRCALNLQLKGDRACFGSC